jgi:peptidylprolyl isomerase
MTQAKEGDNVKVHFTGKLDDGQVFDSSKDREPMKVKIGEGKLISGFEKGIVGMEEGESRHITVEERDAFGPRREDLIMDVKKGDFPEDIDPFVGQQLQIKQPNGNLIPVTVTDVQGDTATLDANHPLAGQTLHFEIELLEIV